MPEPTVYYFTSFLWLPRLLDGEYLKVWTTRAGAEAEIKSLSEDVRSKCKIHEVLSTFFNLDVSSVDGQPPACLKRKQEA
jgi:hypothetical protein